MTFREWRELGPGAAAQQVHARVRALPPAHRLQSGAADPEIREPLPFDCIEVAAHREHRVEPALERDAGRADVAALVGEGRHRDGPSFAVATE